MVGVLNKAKWALKTYGPFKAVYWLIFGYLRVNRFYVYHLPLAQFFEYEDNELTSRFHTPEQLEDLRLHSEFNTYESFISTYLKTSGCLVGYVGQKPAHIMWIFQKGDDSRLFDLSDHDAELNYCYTPASFRGQGIYARMIKIAAAYLARQGIANLYMATHETNEPAQKAITRAGLKKIGTVTNYGVFHRPKWK